ncbi:MAG: cation transporter [Paludibacter sp.]|jgi:copper chaperone CopZ|nr:cation transporter [Paludibacter sp.]
MKTRIIFLALFAFAVTFSAAAKKQTVVFKVSMHCEACQKKIEKNIAFEKGVKDLNVSLEKLTAEITYEDTKTDTAKLKKAIEKLGYTVEEVKTEK